MRFATKYRNTKTVRNDMVFDSKKEAGRFDELMMLVRCGRVRNLRRQVKYELRVNGILIATYKADFVYEEFMHGTWSEVVEDVKGYPNDRFPMKRKLMKACHGIDLRIT